MRRPGQVRLLGYTAFYWPPWNPWGIAQLYRTQRCVMHESMGVHTRMHGEDVDPYKEEA